MIAEKRGRRRCTGERPSGIIGSDAAIVDTSAERRNGLEGAPIDESMHHLLERLRPYERTILDTAIDGGDTDARRRHFTHCAESLRRHGATDDQILTLAARFPFGRGVDDHEAALRCACADDATSDGGHEAAIPSWPVLSPTAQHGLPGEIARVATEHSEADPAAVLLTVMTALGAMMGRASYVRVGDTEHHARLMCALVGATSRARKGTSWGPVRRLLSDVERELRSRTTLPAPLSHALQVTHGPLSSGEGLVAAIRDALGDDDAGGTTDKRLLVVEGELGASLRAMQRQGSTLSMILRTAWDGSEIAPLIKRDRIVATSPHICTVGHITRHELRLLLSAADVWGGLANRLLWACVRRQRAIPSPRPIRDQDLDRLAAAFAGVVLQACEHPAELTLSNSASARWAEAYPALTTDRPGLLGAATARAEAQTLRLALVFALLDGGDRIEEQHVEAGLALWRYCADSAAHLFGGAELDPVVDTIVAALRRGPLSQSAVRDLFGRHQPAARIAAALQDLQERGRATLSVERTRGRPRHVWSLTR